MTTTIRTVLMTSLTAFVAVAGMSVHAQNEPSPEVQPTEALADSSPVGGASRRPRRLGDSMAVSSSQDWVPGLRSQDDSAVLDRKLGLAQRALESGNLLDPADGSALEFFQQALEIDSSSQTALDGIREVARQMIRRARQANADGDRTAALRHLDRVRGFSPDHPGIADLQAEFDRVDELNALAEKAAGYMQSEQLVGAGQENATAVFRSILEIDDSNEPALTGLMQIEQTLLEEGQQALAVGDFAQARIQLELARSVNDGSEIVEQFRADIDAAQNRLWQDQRLNVEQLIQSEQLDQADLSLSALIDSGYPGPVTDLREQIDEQRILLAYVPQSDLVDSLASGAPVSTGPDMVIIGRGEFTMGSPSREDGHLEREGPQKVIRFSRPFAISRTEVTVEEFRRFVEATGYVSDLEKNGESTIFDVRAAAMDKRKGIHWRHNFSGEKARRKEPVVHVSYNDAVAYAAWMSKLTGHLYRLPTESEFEYVLRAGSDTRYWWGDDSPDSRVENLTGDRDTLRQLEWPISFKGYGDGHWGPAPAASFKPNAFGAFDMAGNVMEWVEDCVSKDHRQTPENGRPRLQGNCDSRVIRGGSWANPPTMARSAFRTSASTESGSCLVGFRLVREL